jgi:soluble lytic murein transglycosylase
MIKKLALFIFFSFSCFGKTLPPPKIQLDAIKRSITEGIDRELPQKEMWAKKFLKAKALGRNKASCKLFKSLSKEKAFPLKDMAFIYELRSCNYSKKRLKKIWRKKNKNIPRWALEDYYQASYELAAEKKIKNYQAFFLSKLARYQDSKREKESMILDAIKYNKRTTYLKNLYKISPRYSPRVTKYNIYRVARDFESIRDFKKARELYWKMIHQKKYSIGQKVKAWDRLRLSYKKERDIKTYIEKTREMGRFLSKYKKRYPKNQKVKDYLAKNQINLARAIWTDHKRYEGRKILKNLLTWYHKDGDNLAEVYWVLGSMALEAKDLKKATFYYEKGAKLNISDKDMKDRINWALGWNNYLLGKYKKAIKEFNRYLKVTDNYPLKNKLRYWKAINQKKLGRITRHKKTLKKQIKADPYSYYSVLAHKELNIPLSPLGDKKIKKDVYVLPVFEWLVAMDEIVAAKNYLKRYADKLYTTKMIKKILPLFYRIKWYKEGIAQFQRVDPKDRPHVLGREVPLVFPRPYLDDVSKLSQRLNVEDALIYSITRQESSFDPNARSWAEAYGLMQITPEVAGRLSKRFDFDYNGPTDLFSPKVNLEMGAVLIKELMGRFKNQYVLFVGSYNASHHSVSRWKKERFAGDYVEFIELIPYEETMNYIKLVTRNFFIYKRLKASESFYFPEGFFEKF